MGITKAADLFAFVMRTLKQIFLYHFAPLVPVSSSDFTEEGSCSLSVYINSLSSLFYHDHKCFYSSTFIPRYILADPSHLCLCLSLSSQLLLFLCLDLGIDLGALGRLVPVHLGLRGASLALAYKYRSEYASARVRNPGKDSLEIVLARDIYRECWVLLQCLHFWGIFFTFLLSLHIR